MKERNKRSQEEGRKLGGSNNKIRIRMETIRKQSRSKEEARIRNQNEGSKKNEARRRK